MTTSVFRLGSFSVLVSMRTTIVLVVLGLLILLSGIAGAIWGDFPIPPQRILATLSGEGEKMENFVLFQLRLPRLITAALAGAGFGLSGAIFQSLARNPLASPDVIGFNAGAALGAVVMITMAGAAGMAVTMGALVGGLATALTVAALSWQRGLQMDRVVLIGIGLGLALYAGVDMLLSQSNIFDAAQAAIWMTGSLNGRSWPDAARIALAMVVLLPLGLALSRGMNRLALGEDLAAGLGLRISPLRVWASLIGVAAAAMATSVAGPVAFVALLAGPIARRLTGNSGAALATSALTGGLILSLADLAGRLVLAPMQLPAGLFTAAAGAPFLLWLLLRKPAV